MTKLEKSVLLCVVDFAFLYQEHNKWNGAYLRADTLEEREKCIKKFEQVSRDYTNVRDQLFKLVGRYKEVLEIERAIEAGSE